MTDGSATEFVRGLNNVGVGLGSTSLQTWAPPRIEYIPSELHLIEGDNTEIKAELSGDSPFTVNILRNRSKIVESPKFKMTLSENFLVIFMGDITKEDAGKYTVRVSNTSGSTQESFMIFISGLPGAPLDKNMNDPVMSSSEFCLS